MNGKLRRQSLLRKAVGQSQRDKWVSQNIVGTLEATLDSFLSDLTLEVGLQPLNLGRIKDCTVPYPDGNDTRVPRTAFMVAWCDLGKVV
jgi:hypothetical protein